MVTVEGPPATMFKVPDFVKEPVPSKTMPPPAAPCLLSGVYKAGTTALWPPVTVVPAETVMSVTFAKVVVLVKVTLLTETLPALKDCKKPL